MTIKYSNNQICTKTIFTLLRYKSICILRLESSDYAIIVPIGAEANITALENKLASICGQADMHSLSTARGLTTAVTKITSAGAVSATSK